MRDESHNLLAVLRDCCLCPYLSERSSLAHIGDDTLQFLEVAGGQRNLRINVLGQRARVDTLGERCSSLLELGLELGQADVRIIQGSDKALDGCRGIPDAGADPNGHAPHRLAHLGASFTGYPEALFELLRLDAGRDELSLESLDLLPHLGELSRGGAPTRRIHRSLRLFER